MAKETIMKLERFLDRAGIRAVNDAVTEAEKKTAGEIKILVVQSSSNFSGGSDEEKTKLRANHEFFELGLDHTQGNTGILIMISLDERRVEVRAGQAIDEFYDQAMWQIIVDTIISGIKCGDVAQGICNAVAMSGDILSEHFPIQSDDINEIPNEIVLKE